MGTADPCDAASDRAKTNAIFEGLVKLLKNQQWQLRTLLSQRGLLEDHIKKQNETWVSNLLAYQLHISELKSRLEEKELERVSLAAKSELLVELKAREALVHKLKLEEAKEELADFIALFKYVSASLKDSDDGKKKSDTRSSSSDEFSEVQRLALEHKKLSSQKKALSREKRFIWNQLNILQTNLTNKVKDKQAEADQSHAKLAQVIGTAEQLQSCNVDKDETIKELKARVCDMEEEGQIWKDKVSKLWQELEGLKNKPTEVSTPVLRSCNHEKGHSSNTVKKYSAATNFMKKYQSC